MDDPVGRRFHVWQAGVFLIALTLFAVGPAQSGQAHRPAPPQQDENTAAASPAPPGVVALMERTIVEAGRSRIIAFCVDAAPDWVANYDVRVDDPALVRITRPGEVLPGQTIGYTRVYGLDPGVTTLHIGSASVELTVVGATSHDPPPVITGPATGAVAWGTISIGVEIRQDPDQRTGDVRLRLGDGTMMDPVEDRGGHEQPWRQLRFTFNADDYPDGPFDFTPVTTDHNGRELSGKPVRIMIRRVSPDAIASGEAEAEYDVKRPEGYQDARRNIGRHRDASGGRYFSNAGSIPAVCFPLKVESPGWYQAILRAGGTDAQGALPTVGIMVDGSNYPATNGRLVSRSFHRFACGVPFRLGAGDHVITPYFTNDFYVPGAADRNLMLDYLEIARVHVGRASDSEQEDGEPSMSMSMSPSMSMSMSAPGMGGPMMDDASGPNGDGRDADPYGLANPPVRISFVRVYDQRLISGLLQVEGRCWWNGAERQAPAPVVSLVVNGEPIDEQRSGAPRFWVDPGWFKAGENTVQLVARLDDGSVARTPVQTMIRPSEATVDVAAPRLHRRFSIHDPRWGPDLRKLFATSNYPKERQEATLTSDGEVVLDLPEDLTGSHKLFVECMGDHYKGPPILVCSLRAGGQDVRIGEDKNVPGGWTDLPVGDVELAPGPKQLVLAFTNDLYEKDKGDRNFLFQAVILAQNPHEPDRTAPIAQIEYPDDGAEVYMADAVVGWVADNASVAWVELLIDGVATGINAGVNLEPGDGVIPLPLRQVDPGIHRLSLRVSDVTGNVGESEPRVVRVLAEAPSQPGRFARAVYLLNRLGYGPDPQELEAVLTMGEDQWLDDRLSRTIDDDGDLAALEIGFAYFLNRNNYEVPRRVLSHLVTTPNPVQAHFVQWVENHFSTWIGKVQGDRQWQQHIAFARLGATRFDHLLFASAENPAMIAYLDQERSFARSLNENYAREVMELHTVGVHGGYDQSDVTRLAHVLTGWTASLEGDGMSGGPNAQGYTFRFDPRLNDAGATTVMGLALAEAGPDERYDRARMVLEMLAAHPSTARFISTQLAQHYVCDPVDPDMIDAMSRVFLETGGNMKAVLKTMVAHKAFWDGMTSPRVEHAVDYGVRLERVGSQYQPWLLGDFLQRSGFGIYDRATPDGYPEDDASYTDSNAMTQRWALAKNLRWQLAALVPPGWRYGNGPTDERWAQQVVDMIAIGITGHVLSDASNKSAMDIISKAEGNRDRKVLAVAPFIALLPEANMR